MASERDACVFCGIVDGKVRGSIVYGDDHVLAFMTTGPVNPGHLLVVPRAHVALLAEMDEETGAHLFRVTMRLAQAVRSSGVRCEGINLFLADGEAAFQEIFHLHMHVFPRFQGDAFKLDADWSIQPARDELDEVAARIREAHQTLVDSEPPRRDVVP
jgi:histidine triad (HIT) family protein